MAEALRHALTEAWRDPALPLADRVSDLLSRMTVAEKLGQLGSFWAESARPGEEVAPMPDDLGDPPTLESMLPAGLGQLTRVFGTAPIGPADGTARLRELQEQVVAGNRFGIPAIAHEECLTGFMTCTAPIGPADGTARLRELQEQVVAGNRFGIPAIAHEECLTGFM